MSTRSIKAPTLKKATKDLKLAGKEIGEALAEKARALGDAAMARVTKAKRAVAKSSSQTQRKIETSARKTTLSVKRAVANAEKEVKADFAAVRKTASRKVATLKRSASQEVDAVKKSVKKTAAKVNLVADRKLAELKASGTGTPEAIAQLTGGSEFMGFLAQARDEGRDPLLYEAPIVAIFHSPTKSVTPKDNCVIAATTMGLFARTLGLETTYIALFEAAANAHEPLKKELGLPEEHRVFSVLVMGYPRVKYLRAVDRKPIKTRWE